MEAGTQAWRTVLSGIWERHPNIRITLGHPGEPMRFKMCRIDKPLPRAGGKALGFRDVFTGKLWATISGFFSTPALLGCVMGLGVDRIRFAVDWAFVGDSAAATGWMQAAPLSIDDRNKIFQGNARRLREI